MIRAGLVAAVLILAALFAGCEPKETMDEWDVVRSVEDKGTPLILVVADENKIVFLENIQPALIAESNGPDKMLYISFDKGKSWIEDKIGQK